jgi:hypothetical protein
MTRPQGVLAKNGTTSCIVSDARTVQAKRNDCGLIARNDPKTDIRVLADLRFRPMIAPASIRGDGRRSYF